jgi:UDP-N-acetylmuramoylalanine--D-glutamate ligase
VKDLTSLTSWNADWAGLRVAVLGLGVSGFAVADTLVELGCEVLVLASTADEERADLLDVIGAEFVMHDLQSPPEQLERCDPELVIVSPGFRLDHPLVLWAQDRGTPIWGDIELAWRVRDKVRAAEWICITGTNGKTTTTQLTTHLIAGGGSRVAAVGNIGVPVLDAVRDPMGFDVLVVELSSFQLHWINSAQEAQLSPFASVCLNLAEDHYDWHGSAEAYRDAKAKVYANTRVACVYNKSDAATQRMVEDADVVEGCRAIGFDLGTPGPSDIGLVGDIIVDRAFHELRHTQALELTTHGELAAVGLATPHGVANVLAACALARAWGTEASAIRESIATFALGRHRTEVVAEHAGVSWVDDSKATNPHAADAALTAFDSVVWVVGGLLKGVDIEPLVQRHAARLRAAIVIGVDRTAVLSALQRHAPGVAVFEAEASETLEVMRVAVELAGAVAVSGDTVLLAPAAASMDQFRDYAQRGDAFANAVHDFVKGAGDDTSGQSAPGSDDAGVPPADGPAA